MGNAGNLLIRVETPPKIDFSKILDAPGSSFPSSLPEFGDSTETPKDPNLPHPWGSLKFLLGSLPAGNSPAGPSLDPSRAVGFREKPPQPPFGHSQQGFFQLDLGILGIFLGFYLFVLIFYKMVPTSSLLQRKFLLIWL